MSNFERLQARLAAGETVLMDGGMGSELERRGLASPTTWSGGPMLTHPEAVRDVHEEYLAAGAEVIITNTFGTGRDMLEEGGLEHRVAEANRLGIEAAVQARRNAGTEDSVVIAAAVSTMKPKAHAEVPVPLRASAGHLPGAAGGVGQGRPGRGGGRDAGPHIGHVGGGRGRGRAGPCRCGLGCLSSGTATGSTWVSTGDTEARASRTRSMRFRTRGSRRYSSCTRLWTTPGLGWRSSDSTGRGLSAPTPISPAAGIRTPRARRWTRISTWDTPGNGERRGRGSSAGAAAPGLSTSGH